MRSLLTWSLLSSAAADLDADDLKRARTKKPRSGFLGAGTLASANAKLNRHLYAMDGVNFKECDEFTVGELRDLLKVLHPLASTELKDVYSGHDGRQAVYETPAEMENHWSQVPENDERVRDGHCHEAVMWFVHHLTKAAQQSVGHKAIIPKLPTKDHRVPLHDEEDHAGKFYDSKVTCQECHIGGLGVPFPDDLGPPEEGSKDKSRRCFANYEEDYGIKCGPCDGIAGIYWGDDTDKYYTPPNCVEVGKPEDIPEEERVPAALPNMFSVEIVGGSDRWGRTTNPEDPDITPFTPRQEKMYGQIKGRWHLRADPDDDLWLLRHDTYYGNISWNGEWDPNPNLFYNLTQFHAQSRLQQSKNNTGQMVSLNRSRTWPIGQDDSPDPMCVCVADPVGFPDVTSTRATGVSDMKYYGRIKLAPIEYLGRTVELDHYANWFFQLFMEVNTSAPNYGKSPIRLTSAYSGTAVYRNWIFADPNVTRPGIFSADIPTTPDEKLADSGKYCLNPTLWEDCSLVKTFDDEEGPATWPPQSSGHGDKCADHPGCANLAPHDGLCCPAGDGTRMTCCDHPERPVPGPAQHKQELEATLKGLLADTDGIETCELDGMNATYLFATVVADLKEGRVVDAFNDLSIAAGKIQPLVTDCKVVQAEVQKLQSALKEITPAQAKANYKNHRTDILVALAEWSKADDAQDYSGMGLNIGVMMRKILEKDGLFV